MIELIGALTGGCVGLCGFLYALTQVVRRSTKLLDATRELVESAAELRASFRRPFERGPESRT